MEEFRPGVVKDLLARAREARWEFWLKGAPRFRKFSLFGGVTYMLMGCMYKSVYVHIQISLSLSIYIHIPCIPSKVGFVITEVY